MAQETGWVVNFLTPDGGSHRDPDFPQFEQWQPDRTASKEEGQRVLNELKRRGDPRGWFAYGFPRHLLRPADAQPIPVKWWCIRS